MQNTSQLLMIQPVNFGFNTETAADNPFQKFTGVDVHQKALQEFKDFVEILRRNKIKVTVIEDAAEPPTPDSIYPNNWISFHEDGRVFLYPMFAVNRRHERKTTVLDVIKDKFIVSAITDLSKYEDEQMFLEGTGSMVLDRENKIAYANISARTNKKVLEEFCRISGFKPVTFRSTDNTGVNIYHTNVMMCVANSYVVICLDSITDEEERKNIIASFERTNKEIISISQEQLNSFAGNMLQLKNTDAELLLVMSTQAYRSLTNAQIEAIQKHNRIVHSSLTAIETCGGGSARCMMAEVFLKKK